MSEQPQQFAETESPTCWHCYYERDHTCPTCGATLGHDEYACDQCQQYVGPDQFDGTKSPAEGRVGNHGEGRCANGQPVDGSIPAPKTVDPPQGPQLFDGTPDA